MKTPQTPEDRLLRNLLVESEAAEPDPASPHPDDEMLALFTEGALDPNGAKN